MKRASSECCVTISIKVFKGGNQNNILINNGQNFSKLQNNIHLTYPKSSMNPKPKKQFIYYRNSYIKLLKISDKDEIFKAAREKRHVT